MTVSAIAARLGAGGVRHGPEAMLKNCWAVAAGLFGTRPEPEEQVRAGPDRVVVSGHYRGTVRATGRPYQAAFARDLQLRDGLVARLVQITDTASWTEALTESAA